MNSSHEVNTSACNVSGAGLQQHSPTLAGMIFIITIHFLTFPFTAVLNALVMLAVKLKPQLRAHKSNILLALLALTDFVVGIAIQPAFIALSINFFLNKTSSGACALQRFIRPVMSCLCDASLIHLAFISGERYLAMKHPFAHTTIVTEARLLIASALAWFQSVILHIPLAVDRTLFFPINNTFLGLSIAFIVFCHVVVYYETRRHKQQIAAQQVSQEARKQFENNKKVLKLTTTIVAVLVLSYIPVVVSRNVLIRFRRQMSHAAAFLFYHLAFSMALLNSLINPIIYSIRVRQFRVAFTKLARRAVNNAEAEETRMRVFEAQSAVVRLQTGREHQGQDRTH